MFKSELIKLIDEKTEIAANQGKLNEMLMWALMYATQGTDKSIADCLEYGLKEM